MKVLRHDPFPLYQGSTGTRKALRGSVRPDGAVSGTAGVAVTFLIPRPPRPASQGRHDPRPEGIGIRRERPSHSGGPDIELARASDAHRERRGMRPEAPQ